ncbi:MAG TPA: glutathione S-transferase family protein [Stellaceae bacterium]|nr:glutathione S-transferase family protein [Stellaceae bacterium]
MADDIVLYGIARSSYTRTARLALHEKGVPYRLEPVDFADPAYRAIHPFNRIPALRHGDFVLYETDAICRYVDEAFPGPALQPARPAERARMAQWISMIGAYSYGTMVRDIIIERVVAERKYGRPPDEARIAAALPEAARQLALVDRALAQQPCLAGGVLSLADFFLAPIVFWLGAIPEGSTLLPPVPHVRAWFERMASRPSFKDTPPN